MSGRTRTTNAATTRAKASAATSVAGRKSVSSTSKSSASESNLHGFDGLNYNGDAQILPRMDYDEPATPTPQRKRLVRATANADVDNELPDAKRQKSSELPASLPVKSPRVRVTPETYKKPSPISNVATSSVKSFISDSLLASFPIYANIRTRLPYPNRMAGIFGDYKLEDMLESHPEEGTSAKAYLIRAWNKDHTNCSLYLVVGTINPMIYWICFTYAEGAVIYDAEKVKRESQAFKELEKEKADLIAQIEKLKASNKMLIELEEDDENDDVDIIAEDDEQQEDGGVLFNDLEEE